MTCDFCKKQIDKLDLTQTWIQVSELYIISFVFTENFGPKEFCSSVCLAQSINLFIYNRYVKK